MKGKRSTFSLAKLEGKTIFLNDLAERVYVPDKTSLNINGAESQPGQPLGCSHLAACSNISAFPNRSVTCPQKTITKFAGTSTQFEQVLRKMYVNLQTTVML
jgi:hypothetical protein